MVFIHINSKIYCIACFDSTKSLKSDCRIPSERNLTSCSITYDFYVIKSSENLHHVLGTFLSE